MSLWFVAGMLAAVNPCGFILLPTYLMYFLGVSGGTLVPANDALVVLSPVAGGDSFSLPLPLVPGLVGLLDSYFQGAYFAPENAFGLALTDGLNVYF